MVLQNYQKFIVLTSNMIYIVALVVGFKCPHKIHLNTQCPPLVNVVCEQPLISFAKWLTEVIQDPANV